MGSLRKRGDRFFMCYRDARGRRVQKSAGRRSKQAALKYMAELEGQASRVRDGLDPGIVKMTVNELWAKYAPVAKRKRSWKTLHGRFVNYILPHFGDQKLHQITPGDIERFLADVKPVPPKTVNGKAMRKAPKVLSPQMLEHLRVHLAALFTFAIKSERVLGVRDNPARHVAKTVLPSRRPRFLEIGAVFAFLPKVPDRWRPLFATAVYTGLRKGELCGLQWSDVNLARRILFVLRSYDRDTTKGGKGRVVPIPPELVPYLEGEAQKARSEWVFPAENGSMLTPDTKLTEVLQRSLRRAGLIQGFDLICRTRGAGEGCGRQVRRATSERIPCDRCGRQMEARAVPLTLAFKDLRSTFGTHMTEASGDITTVQRVLGHSDPRLTERTYSFARQQHLVKQSERLSFLPANQLPTTDAQKNQPDQSGPTGATT